MPAVTETFEFMPGPDSAPLPGSGVLFASPLIFTVADYEMSQSGQLTENVALFIGGRPSGTPIRGLKSKVVTLDILDQLRGGELEMVSEYIRQMRYRNELMKSTPLFSGIRLWEDQHILRGVGLMTAQKFGTSFDDRSFANFAYLQPPVGPNNTHVANVQLNFVIAEPANLYVNFALSQSKRRQRGLFVPGVSKTRSPSDRYLNQRVPHR